MAFTSEQEAALLPLANGIVAKATAEGIPVAVAAQHVAAQALSHIDFGILSAKIRKRIAEREQAYAEAGEEIASLQAQIDAVLAQQAGSV